MCHLSSQKEAFKSFEKVYLECHEHQPYPATPSREGSQVLLLYSGSSGSPSQRICTAEVQPVTVILSNGSSGDLPTPAVAPSPSLSSSRHDIQAGGLSPTKYTRAALTSESSAARSSSAGDNAMPSREGLIVISPRKQRGREK